MPDPGGQHAIERATKLAIVLSAIGLLVFDLAIGRAWGGMATAGAVVFALGALLTTLDRRAIGLVLVFAFTFPAVIKLTLDTYAVQFSVLWMAALLGAIAPDACRTPWHLPRRWRGPLVLAALSVAVATPIVVLREIDFNPALLEPVYEAVLSGLPAFFAEWVALVGLTLLLGVLWFDWLLGATDLDFERAIVLPLAASAVVMAAVTVYQLFVDISFLNETVYAAVHRATGTLYDANVCGVIAAAGIGGALAWADRARDWRGATALFVALGLFAIAVWASGSRTAFGATLIVLAVHAWSWRRSRRHSPVSTAPRALVVVAVLAAVFAVVAMSTGDAAVGPLRRLAHLGDRSGSVGGVLAELWNRNGYGAAATNLIGRYPLAGIGIGSFHMFGPQLSPIGALPPDNAQNWLRHQLVEMGVLGALGWFLFTASFAWFTFSSSPRRSPSSGPVVGIVVAFGTISLLGMPTQEISASVAFLTAAAWLARLSAVEPHDGALGRGTWAAILVVTIAFGAATWHSARTDLRVPVRARAFGWPYSYGFYSPEPDPAGGEMRWTARRATALVDITAPTLRIAVRVPHADVASNPVGLKVWCEGHVVIDTRLTSNEPVVATVAAPTGLRQALIDVEVGRTVRPSDFGGTDARELGVLMKWAFLP